MSQIDFQQIFLNSASEVLETMFFTAVAEEEAGDDEAQAISAKLAFHGLTSGEFGVRMPLPTARSVARNFLGFDEVSDSQMAEVVCELSNMLCGSVLSRVDGHGLYALAHPEVDPDNRRWQDCKDAVGYTFGTDEGAVTMWMSLLTTQGLTRHFED